MWDKIFMFPVIEELLWVVFVVVAAATFSFCIYCLLENILLHIHKGSHSITFTLYISMQWKLFFALSLLPWSPLSSLFDISWRYCYCLPFSHSLLAAAWIQSSVLYFYFMFLFSLSESVYKYCQYLYLWPHAWVSLLSEEGARQEGGWLLHIMV